MAGQFLLDRFNGEKWQTLFASPADYPISPETFGRHQGYPYDPKRPAFAGEPGYKARVRYVDVTTDMELEFYDWDKIPENPYYPESAMIWGWKLVKRATYPSVSPMQHMKVGTSW